MKRRKIFFFLVLCISLNREAYTFYKYSCICYFHIGLFKKKKKRKKSIERVPRKKRKKKKLTVYTPSLEKTHDEIPSHPPNTIPRATIHYHRATSGSSTRPGRPHNRATSLLPSLPPFELEQSRSNLADTTCTEQREERRERYRDRGIVAKKGRGRRKEGRRVGGIVEN